MRSCSAATGPHLAALFRPAGLNSCHASCGRLASNFVDSLGGIDTVVFKAAVVIMYLVPALIGIFWGAPLIARELETGTHRLAWNQSVSRTRWTAVKLGLIGAAAVATAGLLSLMIGWWASPIDHAMTFGQSGSGTGFPRLSPLVFAARGVAPLGYAAFAFALGRHRRACSSARRCLPWPSRSRIFAAVQFLMPNFVRPHLIPPVHVTAPFNANNNNEIMISSPGNKMTLVGNFSRPGAWVLSNETDHAIGPGVHRPGRGPRAQGTPHPAAAATGSTASTCDSRSATSRPAASGRCSGSRQASTWSSPPGLPCSAPGRSAAGALS